MCESAMGTGRFLEVYVNTPLEICELRDAKGIYSRARNGEMKNVTGIDDPYEEPLNPEVLLDTVSHTAEENARRILHRLTALGFVTAEAAASIIRDAEKAEREFPIVEMQPPDPDAAGVLARHRRKLDWLAASLLFSPPRRSLSGRIRDWRSFGISATSSKTPIAWPSAKFLIVIFPFLTRR